MTDPCLGFYCDKLSFSPFLCACWQLILKRVNVNFLSFSLQLPASSSDFSLDSLDLESLKDLVSSSFEALHGESDDLLSRY